MSEETFFVEKPQTNILRQIITRFLPYWPVYALLTAIALFIAFIYLRSQTRIYVAASTVLLKDPQKGSGDTKVLEALNIFSEKKIVENEILVLKSSSLMHEVVSSLDLYAVVYNKGKVQTEELYGESSPVLFEALDKSKVVAGGKYPFKMLWKERKLGIDGHKIPFGSVVTIAGTVYRVHENPNYNTEAEGKDFFVIFNSIEGAAGAHTGALQINPLSYQSTVLNIQMNTPVPERGVAILTKLVEVYNKAGIEDKNQIASNTITFIEDRLEKVSRQLDSVEGALQRYQSRNNINEAGGQAGMFAGNLAELDKQKATVDLQQDILNEVRGYISDKGRRPGLVPAVSTIEDPFLSTLLQQLYQAEFERDKLRAVVGEKSDQYINAEQNVNRLRSSINENLANIRQNYAIEKSNIESKIALNSGKLAMVPAKERGMLEISRQQAIKSNIYTYLLQKREETALSSASTTADMRVLESAHSFGPISPIPKKFYTVALLCSLLGFIGYVLLKEQLNNKILFRSELENKTSVPIVGEIVQGKIANPIAIEEGRRTVIAEQFRALRTNIAFAGFNDQNNVALVTSSISGEGKSFISTNLAISLTLTGKKVALVELDLRKPKLHKYLEVKRDPGISNYLIGNAQLDTIIKPTKFPLLSLVSAGPIPPNPTELIGRPEFAKMIAGLKEKFDYIIVDTAPIGPVTDAQLLNPYINLTLYVVRHALTPNTFLRLIDSLNKEKKFKHMGIVFNGVKPRGNAIFNYGFGGYGNGYGYGYGYGNGYGYGYGNEDDSYYQKDKDAPGYKSLFGLTAKLKKLLHRG